MRIRFAPFGSLVLCSFQAFGLRSLRQIALMNLSSGSISGGLDL
jgi:hypothetical protein